MALSLLYTWLVSLLVVIGYDRGFVVVANAGWCR